MSEKENMEEIEQILNSIRADSTDTASPIEVIPHRQEVISMEIGHQQRTICLDWQESDSAEIHIRIQADMTMHLELPASFTYAQALSLLEMDKSTLAALFEEARMQTQDLLRLRLRNSIAETQSVKIFDQIYPFMLYEGISSAGISGSDYVVTIENPADLASVLELVENDIEKRLQVLMENYQNSYMTRFSELPENLPYIVMERELSHPSYTEVATGKIAINPVISQFSESYIEFLAASTLCHLIDKGDVKLHAKLMNEVMPDWQERQFLG